MAAKELVNSQTEVEEVVNRWIVDYYSFRLLELFENKQYADFRKISDVLAKVKRRPCDPTDIMITKMPLLRFLSLINDGETLDQSQSLSPLESALIVLEKINQQHSIPQQDFNHICTSVKEMMVVIFIKNNMFGKAKEVLNKHFPKPMVGKKAIFMGLISQKSNTHKIIEQFDFEQFKEEMFAFCQSLWTVDVPFLQKAAIQLKRQRMMNLDDKASEPDQEEESGPSSSPQRDPDNECSSKQAVITRARLEIAFNSLVGPDENTFAELEEEVHEEQQGSYILLRVSPTPPTCTEQNAGQNGLFQRDSGSPMEASPADQPPQMDAVPQTQAGSISKSPQVLRNRRPYTVARLVVEPDTQGGSQCTTASQELETEVRTEEPPQSPAVTNKKELQSRVTDIDTRKRSASSSLAELSAEEDPIGSVDNGETLVRKFRNKSKRSSRTNSTQSNQLSSNIDEQRANNPLSKDPGNTGDDCMTESSLDSSPEMFSHHRFPQTSSTPDKDSPQGKGASTSKWKQVYNNAKESKDTWSDEESYFPSKRHSESHNESTVSNSGNRKKQMWTESETLKLKEGVQKFGEGNWNKIKAYYSFKDRTNVNLKDRWRTLKKLNLA